MRSKETTGVRQGLPETDDLYPFCISPRGEKYCVENRITSTIFGYYPTYESAKEKAAELKIQSEATAARHVS